MSNFDRKLRFGLVLGQLAVLKKMVRLKFGRSAKQGIQNLKKYIPYGFDKSADLLSKREEGFFKLCVLLKKSELYKQHSRSVFSCFQGRKKHFKRKKVL